MFNQFGRPRPNPANPYGSASFGQKPQPTAKPIGNPVNAQYKPDFLRPSNVTNPSGQAPVNQSSPNRLQRIKPDAFGSQAPQSQRAALFDQARQQISQTNQLSYEHLRNPSAALPGGLTERQRAEFKMLQRSDPAAAQKQLMNYQRTADIRYNKPQAPPLPPSGSANHRPPSNFSGPRPHFGF